jgi:hypothetical protein
MVNVVDPVGVTEAESKLAVAPVGSPETSRATEELKPSSAVSETVYVALSPAQIVPEEGDIEIVKSGFEGL